MFYNNCFHYLASVCCPDPIQASSSRIHTIKRGERERKKIYRNIKEEREEKPEKGKKKTIKRIMQRIILVLLEPWF